MGKFQLYTEKFKNNRLGLFKIMSHWNLKQNMGNFQLNTEKIKKLSKSNQNYG